MALARNYMNFELRIKGQRLTTPLWICLTENTRYTTQSPNQFSCAFLIKHSCLLAKDSGVCLFPQRLCNSVTYCGHQINSSKVAQATYEKYCKQNQRYSIEILFHVFFLHSADNIDHFAKAKGHSHRYTGGYQ